MSAVEPRVYIVLTGTKELLDHIEFKQDLNVPWTEDEWANNKPIIHEYLMFVHNRAQRKING